MPDSSSVTRRQNLDEVRLKAASFGFRLAIVTIAPSAEYRTIAHRMECMADDLMTKQYIYNDGDLG